MLLNFSFFLEYRFGFRVPSERVVKIQDFSFWVDQMSGKNLLLLCRGRVGLRLG